MARKVTDDPSPGASGPRYPVESVAKAAELPGLEAEANLQLVRVYLQVKQPQKAAVCIKQGMRDVEHSEDSYDLPLFVAAEAETEAALNHVANAAPAQVLEHSVNGEASSPARQLGHPFTWIALCVGGHQV